MLVSKVRRAQRKHGVVCRTILRKVYVAQQVSTSLFLQQLTIVRKAYVAYYGANSLCFTIDCKKRNINAGNGQTAILCILSSIDLYQCIIQFIYMFRCINFTSLARKTRLRCSQLLNCRETFFIFREVGSSNTCIAHVQVQIRK